MTAASTQTEESLALTSMASGRSVVRAMLTDEPGAAVAFPGPAGEGPAAGAPAQKKGWFQECPAPTVWRVGSAVSLAPYPTHVGLEYWSSSLQGTQSINAP